MEQDRQGLHADDAARLLDALGDLKAELLYKAIDPVRLVAIRERLDGIKAAADLLRRLLLLHEVFLGCHEALLPPKAIFRDREDTPALVVIPAGRFLMGSPEDEEARRDNEGPQHEVRIARRFALGRFPVTFEEYDRFPDATGRERPWDQGWGRGRQPRHQCLLDTKAYVNWLGEQTGRSYRLLSEAEWEYACRAGTMTRYWWGDKITPENANFEASGIGKTVEVGSYPANPWALYDMHGNVWEWIEDSWHGSYSDAPADGSAWTSEGGGRRVVRGGAWDDEPWVLRAAFRDRVNSDYRSFYNGFRMARTLTP